MCFFRGTIFMNRRRNITFLHEWLYFNVSLKKLYLSMEPENVLRLSNHVTFMNFFEIFVSRVYKNIPDIYGVINN